MRTKALFIHIPKNGGISVLSAKVKVKGHFIQNPFYLSLKDTLKFYREKPYVFSFVRNPWDRLVSAFFYLDQGGMNPGDKFDRRKYLKEFNGNFERFVYESLIDCKVLEQLHFKPQYDWISDDNGSILADYVGRFENLQTDLKLISKKTGITFGKLPHINRSKHKSYHHYYNNVTRDIVAEVYKHDIELFNYDY